MGLGSGHVLDMIKRSKQNRAQRPSQRRKFKDYGNKGLIVTDATKRPQFKTVSDSELKSIKDNIKVSAKKEQRKLMFKRIVTFFIVIIVFVLLFRYL